MGQRTLAARRVGLRGRAVASLGADGGAPDTFLPELALRPLPQVTLGAFPFLLLGLFMLAQEGLYLPADFLHHLPTPRNFSEVLKK